MAIKNIVATQIKLSSSPLTSGIDVYNPALFRGNVTIQGTLLASGIAAIGSVVSASNVGTGVGVFKALSSGDLQFKTLVTGNTNLALTSETNDVKFDIGNSGLDVTNQAIFRGNLIVQGTLVASGVGTGGSGSVSSASNVGGGIGFFNQLVGSNLQFKTLIGRNNNTLVTSGLTVNTVTTGNSGLDVTGNTISRGNSVIQGNLTVNTDLTVNQYITNPRLDTAALFLYDGLGNNSLDWEFRDLYNSGSVSTLNWQDRVTYDSSSLASINWGNRFLLATDGAFVTVDWGNRLLGNSGGTYVVDWDAGVLKNSSESITVDWESEVLRNSVATVVIDWEHYFLQDGSATPIIDWNNQILYAPDTTIRVQWVNGQLRAASENEVLNWNSQYLRTDAGAVTLNWGTGQAKDTSNVNSFNWDTRILQGAWKFSSTLIANSGLDVTGNTLLRGTTTLQGRLIGQPVLVISGTGAITTNRDISDSFIVDATGNITLNTPTNGIEGDKIKWKFIADGAARTVTLSSSFAIPSGSTLVSPFTVNQSTTTVFLAEKMGTRWLVESYLPGY